nr:hypothetical protein 2a - Trypanosoma brucei mitochondrion [Trypanosoma brucei]
KGFLEGDFWGTPPEEEGFGRVCFERRFWGEGREGTGEERTREESWGRRFWRRGEAFGPREGREVKKRKNNLWGRRVFGGVLGREGFWGNQMRLFAETKGFLGKGIQFAEGGERKEEHGREDRI